MAQFCIDKIKKEPVLIVWGKVPDFCVDVFRGAKVTEFSIYLWNLQINQTKDEKLPGSLLNKKQNYIGVFFAPNNQNEFLGTREMELLLYLTKTPYLTVYSLRRFENQITFGLEREIIFVDECKLKDIEKYKEHRTSKQRDFQELTTSPVNLENKTLYNAATSTISMFGVNEKETEETFIKTEGNKNKMTTTTGASNPPKYCIALNRILNDSSSDSQFIYTANVAKQAQSSRPLSPGIIAFNVFIKDKPMQFAISMKEKVEHVFMLSFSKKDKGMYITTYLAVGPDKRPRKCITSPSNNVKVYIIYLDSSRWYNIFIEDLDEKIPVLLDSYTEIDNLIYSFCGISQYIPYKKMGSAAYNFEGMFAIKKEYCTEGISEMLNDIKNYDNIDHNESFGKASFTMQNSAFENCSKVFSCPIEENVAVRFIVNGYEPFTVSVIGKNGNVNILEDKEQPDSDLNLTFGGISLMNGTNGFEFDEGPGIVNEDLSSVGNTISDAFSCGGFVAEELSSAAPFASNQSKLAIGGGLIEKTQSTFSPISFSVSASGGLGDIVEGDSLSGPKNEMMDKYFSDISVSIGQETKKMAYFVYEVKKQNKLLTIQKTKINLTSYEGLNMSKIWNYPLNYVKETTYPLEHPNFEQMSIKVSLRGVKDLNANHFWLSPFTFRDFSTVTKWSFYDKKDNALLLLSSQPFEKLKITFNDQLTNDMVKKGVTNCT